MIHSPIHEHLSTIVEIIHLRSLQRPPREIYLAIVESLRAMAESEPQVRLYAHLRVVGDLSVHLIHESTDRLEQASHLGLRLAEALKEYGLVEHSVWGEITDLAQEDRHEP
ncbi:MAG: hypothetical protein JRI23_25430 [Deltaproteobacteria bacterium]|nr:hypothetical protein [Deltaproteobacteria bacterium]MBW2535361.1 hypothetical protein [Deltaproteobacteria bacterium]